MENRGILIILNWRHWPTQRKARIIGCATGAFLSVAIPVLEMGADPHEPFGLVHILGAVLRWPTVKICQAFHCKLLFYEGDQGPSIVFWILMILINSILSLIGGSLLGFVAKIFKQK